ncbi:MAG: aminodeoxychorismate lyase [Gammaproteobacteria bacterium]|jgi:4-amino-4-deoxychorismate lyase
MYWHYADGVHAPGPDDRGFAYGDGVFETIAVRGGHPRLLDRHLARFRTGAARLRLQVPREREILDLMKAAIAEAPVDAERAVLKLVLTRGDGERGYAYGESAQRLFAGVSAARRPAETRRHGVAVRWCRTRLGRNPALAGIKHLNRLEQVLARAEWQDQAVAEGLMLDAAGFLVCATMSNLFLVLGGSLVTPALTHAGVAGVMRAEVLQIADERGIPVEVREVRPQEVERADAVFLTNSQYVLWPVTRLGGHHWREGALAAGIRAELSGRGIVE